MKRTTADNSVLSKDIKYALERDELLLHYQPIIDLQNHCVSGTEALLRWQHPRLGLIGPIEFIPLAEQQNLMMPISDWVMRQACAQCRTWQEKCAAPLTMSVNISAPLFDDPTFTETVTHNIKDTGIDPNCLILEITESTVMNNPDQALKTLADLHELGVNLALDDFGTGYSSLSYLKNFPVDTIKIDRSFMHELATDPANLTIIKSILMLANGLNMRAVVAEGVETEQQKQILADNGVRYFQGFYFSKPLSADDCEGFIQDYHA